MENKEFSYRKAKCSVRRGGNKMKSNLNEDEILVLLNDVTITDNELSSFEFNDIEKES